MALTSSQLLNEVKKSISEVTPDEVRRGLQSGEIHHIVDVRERDEVMDGYIPGANLIPRGFLELNVEEDVGSVTIRALQARGHDVRVVPPRSISGCATAVMIDPETGTRIAAADPRRDCYAAAY